MWVSCLKCGCYLFNAGEFTCMKRLHERCMRVTYDDHQASFEELLEADNSVSAHCKNLQCVAIELYKVFNGISPDIIKDVFPLSTSSNYNIRNRLTFYSRPLNSVCNGTSHFHTWLQKYGNFFLTSSKHLTLYGNQ